MEPAATPEPELAGSPGRAAERVEGAVGISASGLDAREFDCIQCGYALRGLPAAGLCPECARPVADSLGRWELRYAERGHLKRLSLGLWLIISGTAWFSIGFIVLDGLRFVQIVDAPGVVILRYSLELAVVVAGCGVWVFTRPEPRATGQWRLLVSRRVARAATVWYIIALALLMHYADLHAFMYRQFMAAPSQGSIFGALIQLRWVDAYALPAAIVSGRAVLLAALMHLARGLAERAEDAVLVRRCELFRWLLPLLAVLGGGWVFVPARGDELYLMMRLMTPTALTLACIVLRCVHDHVREVLVVDAVKKDYGSD